MTWTFRNIALGCSAALFTVVSLLTLALVISTSNLHQISIDLMSVSNNLRTTQELEANILIHSRESLLWNLTGDDSHLYKRDQVKVIFENWLEQSDQYDESQEKQDQLKVVKDAAENYFKVRSQYEEKNAPAIIVANEVSPYTDQLLATLRKFTLINLSQAQEAQAAAKKTENDVITIGAVAILTALIGLTFLLYFLWRHIYIPLNKMAVSINDLAAGTKIAPVTTKVQDVSIIWHALDESSRQLQRQKETQLRYLAAIAHDLRNPIGAIAASASFLSEIEDLPEDTVEITQIINRQVGYLNIMVSDLLDTTRAEGGSLSLKMSTQDLRVAVNDAVSLFRGYSQKHLILYEQPEEAFLCKYDSMRISQVLNNLISNAIKYTPLGGKITVSLFSENNMVCVLIADTGIGVSAEEKLSIFEPFRRSNSTKDTIPGVGLGLFTSQKIIGAHGGSITVESVVGEGSTFIVKIPIH